MPLFLVFLRHIMLFHKHLLSASLLFICCTLHASVNFDGKASCQSESLLLTTDFESARVNDCKINGNHVSISIKPENKPINDSPWYAFKLQAKTASEVTVRVKYYGGKHRYHPKASVDGVSWTALPYRIKNGDLVFQVTLGDTPLLVAGQEIVSNHAYENWMQNIKTRFELTSVSLGQSVQGRAITALLSKGQSDKYLLVIGRQHPPEITGALAYFPFSETLLENSTFRQHYNIVFVPNINPDGVALGHWRHNVNGVDLNRDWKHFKQPETAAIKQYLDTIVKRGGKITYGVDFHSTHHDVFYTMPQGKGLTPDDTTVNWLERLALAEPNFTVLDKPGHNPGRGVFKQWLSDTYGVHAITYEMGDNTNRKVIKQVAISAANTLSETLLNQSKTAK